MSITSINRLGGDLSIDIDMYW